jgi:hypothetical protein
MQFSNHSRGQDRFHWLTEMSRAYALISNTVGDPTVAGDLIFLKELRWLREDQSDDCVHSWALWDGSYHDR